MGPRTDRGAPGSPSAAGGPDEAAPIRKRPTGLIQPSSQLYSVETGELRRVGGRRLYVRQAASRPRPATQDPRRTGAPIAPHPPSEPRSRPERPRPEREQRAPDRPARARRRRADQLADWGRPTEERSLGQSSKLIAIANAVSRVTGFLRQIVITAAIGLALVGDAYNTANYLPNIIYELLLGGVLTSVVVPLLVHAQRADDDHGLAYAQRLITLTVVGLTVATAITIVFAPELVQLFGISRNADQIDVATLWARLLLPEIIFYGLGALLGALLNTRGSYGPPAWAPVLNNVVVIATAGVFIAMPGPATLNPQTITEPEVLVLGIGTTAGIIAQTLVLLPALRRIGFRWRWRLDLRGSGIGQDTPLLLWVLGYVVVSYVGYSTIVHISNSADTGAHGAGYAVYSNVSLLFQAPYGIVGVALLTVLLPRMSRSAAAGDTRAMLADVSLGSRLTAVGLVPVTAAFIVLGPSITVMIFNHGRSGFTNAHYTGVALAWSAFGLLPYAITLLQMRAFYAVKDARTPTLINVGMVAVRLGLCALVAEVVSPENVVIGLAVANSLSFVVGWVLGEVLLRRRFGPLGSTAFVRTCLQLVIASAFGGVAAWLVLAGVTRWLNTGALQAAVATLGGCVVGGAVMVAVALRLRVSEVRTVLGGLRRQFGS
jgi:putative peptidoglycan lipid II flippase